MIVGLLDNVKGGGKVSASSKCVNLAGAFGGFPDKC
jgi:hypothetical protein